MKEDGKMISYRNFAANIITRHCQAFLKSRKGVMSGNSAAALHDLRVVSRRLRNAFWVFRDLFCPLELQKWRQRIRDINIISGEARDYDIDIGFISGFKNDFKREDDREILENILCRLRWKRAFLDKKILAFLEEMEKEDIIGAIIDFLEDVPFVQNGRNKLFKTAKKRISKRLKAMLIFERYVRHPSEVTKLHEMRIAAKHVRYTLETFREFFGKKIDGFIQSAACIQSTLGDFHDYDIWVKKLSEFKGAQENKKSAVILSRVEKKCETIRSKAYDQFMKSWRKYQKEKLWDRLRDFLSSHDR